MNQEFMNVKENWTIHDTVLLYPPSKLRGPQPSTIQGWFGSWAALAGANDHPFFNVRNRTIGLYWNNQDVRDTFAYAYELESAGIRFFASTMSMKIDGDDVQKFDNVTPHIWVCDMPYHASAVVTIQQDERLKANVAMLPSGHGIQGDGYGAGQFVIPGDPGFVAEASHYDSMNQGVTEMSRRWVWPLSIGVPRRANFSLKIVFSEYAKDVIANFNQGWTLTNSGNRYYPIAGIQVTLKGKRFVQQRGELHA